jgi:Glycosyltransferase 61
MKFLRKVKSLFFSLSSVFRSKLYEDELTHIEYFNKFYPTYFSNIKLIFSDEVIGISVPKSNINFLPWRFNIYQKRLVNKSFVAIFKNSHVFSSKGHIITEENILILDLSRSFGVPKRRKKLGNRNLITTKKNEAKVAVLTTDGSNTYYHWLFDILPRIQLLKKSGIFEDIDFFVLPKLMYDFQKSTLAYFNIQNSKILEINDNEAIFANDLIVPSLPSELGTVNLWALNFIRDTFLPKSQMLNPNKRIYISRKNATARRILNESEIIEYLVGLGFEIIEAENLSFDNQVKLFTQAEVVVSPHGSGLSNIVFCNKKTKVIDLFYGKFLVPCFWVIAAQLDLDYYYETSTDLKQDFSPYWESKGHDDFFPLEKLKKILKTANIINE